jgi:hypothetical protein
MAPLLLPYPRVELNAYIVEMCHLGTESYTKWRGGAQSLWGVIYSSLAGLVWGTPSSSVDLPNPSLLPINTGTRVCYGPRARDALT